MKYHISQTDHKPAYLQLYEQIRNDITGKILPFGSKLPSKRLLAAETQVSIITIQHAYAILCDEGYVEARQRSGYFVIYKESDFLRSAEPAPASLLPLYHTHSSKSTFPFSVLSKTMRRVLTDYQEDILVRSPNHGCPQLRSAICAYLARSRGITTRPEQIIIGSGAEYLYSLIAQLLGKDRIFALENPSYDKIRRVYQTHGIHCDLLKMNGDGIRSSELLRTEASVLHTTPFHSYPSGITASASKRREYLNWALERGGYIIEDNYDSELTVSRKPEDPLFTLMPNCPVIYLNTFSETIAPSIRAGYLILPEQLLKPFDEQLGFYSCTVPLFEQYVLTELINSGDFERHINRVRRARRKEG